MARHYSQDHRDTYRLREASQRERSQMRRAARADKVTARMIYGTA